MSEFFLDVWTFGVSQVGLFAIGVLAGSWWGSGIKREVASIIDKIDGKVG